MKTSMPPEACIKRLRRVTDTAGGFRAHYHRDFVMRVHKEGFNLWRVADSAMPSKIDICSPVFKARFSRDGQPGTVISGRFGMRPVGGLLVFTVVLFMAIITLVFLPASPASLWAEFSKGTLRNTAITLGLIGTAVWAWFGWRTDKASLIEFLQEYLRAEQVDEKQILRPSE